MRSKLHAIPNARHARAGTQRRVPTQFRMCVSCSCSGRDVTGGSGGGFHAIYIRGQQARHDRAARTLIRSNGYAPEAAVFLRLLSSTMVTASASVGSGDGVFPADDDRCMGSRGIMPSIWEPNASRGGRVPKWPAEKLGLW